MLGLGDDIMKKEVHIIHSSVYASDPEKAALNVAALIDGIVKPFFPCEGAWVCFLNDKNWDGGEFIEFYPKSVKLSNKSGNPAFLENPEGVSGAGTHFNLSAPKNRENLESICQERNLMCALRGWGNVLDVWLEENLLIECVFND